MLNRIKTPLALFLACALLAGAASPALGAEYLRERDENARYDVYESDGVIPDTYVDLSEQHTYHTQPVMEELYSFLGAESLCIQVKTLAGSSLKASVDSGSVKLDKKRLQPSEKIVKPRYDYYLLTVTSTANRETDAAESFDIRLESDDEWLTLTGETAYSPVQRVYSGVPYQNEEGVLYQFREELEEEVSVTCAKGLTLAFKGDYEEEEADLSVAATLPSAVSALLPGGAFAYYQFVESPTLVRDVTVRIQGKEGLAVYEYRRGALSEIAARYEKGAYTFRTNKLTCYVLAGESAD